jgi:hypothetical protein
MPLILINIASECETRLKNIGLHGMYTSMLIMNIESWLLYYTWYDTMNVTVHNG